MSRDDDLAVPVIAAKLKAQQQAKFDNTVPGDAARRALGKVFMDEITYYNDGNGCTRRELVDRLLVAVSQSDHFPAAAQPAPTIAQCIQTVLDMDGGWTVEVDTGRLVSDKDGPWFHKADVINTLKSLAAAPVEDAPVLSKSVVKRLEAQGALAPEANHRCNQYAPPEAQVPAGAICEKPKGHEGLHAWGINCWGSIGEAAPAPVVPCDACGYVKDDAVGAAMSYKEGCDELAVWQHSKLSLTTERARVSELRAALRPLAQLTCDYPDDDYVIRQDGERRLTMRDVRRARALTEEK